MAQKILSQAEMNALLKPAPGSAPRRRVAAPGAVARYNFRRPDRVSREQIHSLHHLHDRFARNVATSLSAYLRSIMEMSVVSVEQLAYAEFLTSLSDPTAFYALAIAPFTEVGALEINPSVAFAMIDRMLGGGGRAIAFNRALSEIEQSVVDAVVKVMLEGLSETWKPVVELAFGIRGRETRPQMLRVAAPNEMIVSIVFDLKFNDARGTMSLGIPASIVESAGASFAQVWQRQRRELSTTEQSWLRESLGRIPVPVVSSIQTHLPAEDVLALRVGDVVSLGVPATQPIDVHFGGVPKLTGQLALDGTRMKVNIGQRSIGGAA